MIIGLSFKIQQNTNILPTILDGINVKDYCWYNIDSQNEVWDSPQGELFFSTEYYNGTDFAKHIEEPHFIVFLKLLAFNKKCKFYDVQTYEEFRASDCQLLLLIYDCQQIEIYAKSQNIIEIIFQNALKNKFYEVTYITDKNNRRTKMNIL